MKLIFSLSLFLFSVTTLLAQTLYTHNDSIHITQDSVTIKAGPFRGNIQWQKSLDHTNWVDLEGKTADSLKIKPDAEAMYRAKITEGTCFPVYSDTLLIKPLDLKSEITERIDSLLPENIVSLIQAEITENETLPDYEKYLVEMNDATKTLLDTVKKYSSPGELEQAILKFKSDFENPVLKSSNSLGCDILNCGLGYAKGVSVNASVGVGVSYIISLELKAQQGGGAEIVYDFVNQTRQIYIYKMCSLNETFGAGMGGGFSGSLGVSGYIKWLTNIAFYQQNSMNRFAGASKSKKYGISGTFAWGLGFSPGVSIGTSKGVVGDCDNVYNLFQCPVYFNEQEPNPDGVTSFITSVSASGSAGSDFELVAAISAENATSCSSGINESYIDYRSGGKSRILAALKMAAEVIITSPISGLSVIGSSFDLTAAAAAISYGTLNVENCPMISFATVNTSSIMNITSNAVDILGNIESDGGAAVTARGVCWSTSQNPTTDNSKTIDGTGAGSFTSSLTGLSANTPYYVRAYATNSQGTAYGAEVSFTTGQTIIQPTVTTNPITAITQTTATSGGNIISNGGATITASGICWSTSQDPTTATNFTTDGNTSSFTSNLTGLTANATYYVWAYAINSAGTGYGSQVPFTTGQAITLPVVTITDPITAITQTTATSVGIVTSDGGAAIIARGVCWSTTTNPTITNSKTTDGTGTGSFTSNFTGLTANTNYYVRAYATNSAGTAYGNEVTFITSQAITQPTITTNAITAITQTTATSGGNVTSDGGATVTARGVCWSTSKNPTIVNSKIIDVSGTDSFTSGLSSLTANTTYYVRAYATNSANTAYGNEVTFITLPSVNTKSIASVTQNTATSGGYVNIDGNATIAARGVCWNTSGNPTITNDKTFDGSGTADFSSNITGLAANTTYYVRAYATNNTGTAYGNEVTFTTSSDGNLTGTFIDSRDNKTYKWVKIGDQTWMAENLAYLPAVSPSSAGSITEPYYYVYGYEGADVAAAKNNANYTTYGVLYNWPAAKAACPPGWHLPSDDEWKQLEKALGMTQAQADAEQWRGTDQGTQLKATSGWVNNGNGTNTSNFSALPGGTRFLDLVGGSFHEVTNYGFWWSSTEDGTDDAWHRGLGYGYSSVGRANGGYKGSGFSVRCVRDDNTEPTLSTSAASSITTTSASSGGNISSDGGASVTARGVCWSTSQNPTIANSKTTDGSGTGSFTSNLTDLTANSPYYLRAYATNSAGTAYGNQVNFTTEAVVEPGTVTDIDGNVYNTVTIGTQVWMVENLKTTRYRNGDLIPNVTDQTQWINLTTGAYCNYDNDNNNVSIYGRLYNWYAVSDNRNIAPAGWHIPTDADWTTLSDFLGGELVAGGKMKSTSGWVIGNGTNTSGFTALPGGCRHDYDGKFSSIGANGNWWSSTEYSTLYAKLQSLWYDRSSIGGGHGGKSIGFSVRCVRDL